MTPPPLHTQDLCSLPLPVFSVQTIPDFRDPTHQLSLSNHELPPWCQACTVHGKTSNHRLLTSGRHLKTLLTLHLTQTSNPPQENPGRGSNGHGWILFLKQGRSPATLRKQRQRQGSGSSRLGFETPLLCTLADTTCCAALSMSSNQMDNRTSNQALFCQRPRLSPSGFRRGCVGIKWRFITCSTNVR